MIACARPFAPPGGELDETPPRVVASVPEPLSTVEPGSDPVVFRFDQTLSERGVSDAIVLVSPATGEASVTRGGSEIRVRLSGGWQENLVYRVVLLPGLRDRYGNERREPAELVFSTGPEIPESAIAGLVLDRVTGRPARSVVVQATGRADSVTYATVVDTAGFFALRHLPAGTYDVRAFEDRNSNRLQEPTESFARGTALTINRANDTLTAVLQIVPADTTPPRVTAATARDSLQIRVSTDDHLDPDAPLEFVQIQLFTLPDTVPVPGEATAMSVAAFDSTRAAAARAAALDTVDVVEPPPAGPPGPREPPLPQRELVIVPPRPLVPDQEYFVRLQGLVNVSGRPGGGGSATFTAPQPPPVAPDTTAVDTTIVRDTTGALPARGRPILPFR